MAFNFFGNSKPNDKLTKEEGTEQLGVAGIKMSSGLVHDEYLPQLTGDRGRKTYREMKDNDAIVASILFAIEMLIRGVDWVIEGQEKVDEDLLEEAPFEGVPKTHEEAVKWLDGCLMKDMSSTFPEFINMTLSMIQYGWQYTEIVFKVRGGLETNDITKKSIYNDGLIGIRKLGDRSQETLDRWDMDDNGEVLGLFQQPPNGGVLRYIPMTKSLLFRPHQFKGSPEGRSVLRSAYRSWYFLKNLQEIEAIAIERELNGLPVVYIPNAILNGTDAKSIASKAAYEKLVRDIKLNDQGGVVFPSDPWMDNDGNPTSIRQVEFDLVSAGGSRAIDVGKSITRYQQDIARIVLADFIMLGSDSKGSFALSKDKSSMFTSALKGWLDGIASVINRELIPKIWELNGFARDIMPKAVPGKIHQVDLEELGRYIETLARAGAPLFPDEKLEAKVREIGGLPEKGEETGDVLAGLDLKTKPDRDIDLKKNINASPAQIKAQNRLNSAIRSGKVKKPCSCVACRKKFPSNQLQSHHPDYSKPLDVVWYCQSCHGANGHGKKKRI